MPFEPEMALKLWRVANSHARRLTLKPFEIRQGTLENKDGDVEWHLSSYTRTGRKKQYL
jgi:hypothetical protein